MLVQIEQPDSETALYSIVWMYHNWTPVEGYLSCSFRLFLKFYYTQLCCNEYPLCTSLIVEWMLRSPIGSEAICICNFDSCWQIVLHRGYTNLYSNSNVWEKFFAHSLMTQCYLNFLIIANLKDAVFHFGAILICIYLTWVSLTIVQVLKVYAYTFFCELSVHIIYLLEKVSTVSVVMLQVLFSHVVVCLCSWRFLLCRVLKFLCSQFKSFNLWFLGFVLYLERAFPLQYYKRVFS